MRRALLCIVVFCMVTGGFALSDPDFNNGSGWTTNGSGDVTFNGRCVISKNLFDTVTEVYQQEPSFSSGTWKATFYVDTVTMGSLQIGWQNASATWKSGSNQTVSSAGTYEITCDDSSYNWVVIQTVGSIVTASLESCNTEAVSSVDSWELY